MCVGRYRSRLVGTTGNACIGVTTGGANPALLRLAVSEGASSSLIIGISASALAKSRPSLIR